MTRRDYSQTIDEKLTENSLYLLQDAEQSYPQQKEFWQPLGKEYCTKSNYSL